MDKVSEQSYTQYEHTVSNAKSTILKPFMPMTLTIENKLQQKRMN